MGTWDMVIDMMETAGLGALLGIAQLIITGVIAATLSLIITIVWHFIDKIFKGP